jgi:hypothetical protein
MPPKEPNDDGFRENWSTFSQEEFDAYYQSWPSTFIDIIQDIKNTTKDQPALFMDHKKVLDDALSAGSYPWILDTGNSYSYTSLYYNEKAPVELPKTEAQNNVPIEETKSEEPSKEGSIFTKLNFEKEIE